VFSSLPEDGIVSSPLRDPIWGLSRPPKQWVSIWWLKKPDRHADDSIPVMLSLRMLSDVIPLSHAKCFSAYLSIRIQLHGLVLYKTLIYA
jgi:hypothetical protein